MLPSYHQVDGMYAAVKFPSKDGDSSVVSGDVTTQLSDCRLLRKDELQVVKGTTAPRIPDCFQRTPKKLSIEMTGQILAVTVDNQGGRSAVFVLFISDCLQY